MHLFFFKPLTLILIGSVYAIITLFTLSSCNDEKLSIVKTNRPNIVILYVDDLGYGDVGCYGAQGVVTPNIDELCKNGIKFTDAHSPAATCTPSRYALLTGEYAFRRNAEVLPGNANLIIPPDKPTLPKMLHKAGYKSAVVGKWHLGLGNGDVDWNGKIAPGPLEIGFDYSFLIPATGDRVPSVYVENHQVVGLDKQDSLRVSYSEKIGDRPTGKKYPELLRQQADAEHSNTIINGISRIGYMAGGESAVWKDEDFPDLLTNKAFQFIQENKEIPFFLYFSFHDIHVPRLPNPRFKGKSSMGPRGDAITQVDWMTGEIVKKLDNLGLLENTIIVFTSDNGPVLNDGYEDQAIQLLGNHKPSGIYRGGKYSIFEAGTRVPTLIYWKDHIKPCQSSALINQTDFYASFAQLIGQNLVPGEAMDSQNLLPALLGSSKNGSNLLLEEGYTLALRDGNWKYIEPTYSTHEWIQEVKGIESGLCMLPQLYDLSKDPEEKTNLAKKFPEKLCEMHIKLTNIKNKKKHSF